MTAILQREVERLRVLGSLGMVVQAPTRELLGGKKRHANLLPPVKLERGIYGSKTFAFDGQIFIFRKTLHTWWAISLHWMIEHKRLRYIHLDWLLRLGSSFSWQSVGGVRVLERLGLQIVSIQVWLVRKGMRF